MLFRAHPRNDDEKDGKYDADIADCWDKTQQDISNVRTAGVEGNTLACVNV